MTIPELILDDLTLTWDNLVDIGRRAIPPGSDGIWTQHGPVDPGITLMELFAYQLEQRLYMLDRVPDTLIRAVFARLAGPDAAPRPATAATTTLSLSSDTRLELPAETQLTRIIDGRELLLTTSAPVVVTPGAAIARVELDGVELPTGTFAGHVFGRSGLAPARIRLTATGPATEHLLYVGLADDPLPGVPPDTVRWTADRDLSVEDGTLGLRRSGIVRLRAADGLPLPATVDLVVSRDPEDGPVWPRLTALAVNAVPAAHSHRVQASITSGPLPAVPSLQLGLPDRPPIDDPARFSVIAGADERWTVVADLAFSGPGRPARAGRPARRPVDLRRRPLRPHPGMAAGNPGCAGIPGRGRRPAGRRPGRLVLGRRPRRHGRDPGPAVRRRRAGADRGCPRTVRRRARPALPGDRRRRREGHRPGRPWHADLPGARAAGPIRRSRRRVLRAAGAARQRR